MAEKNKKFLLEFEKPVIELENKINEMRDHAASSGIKLGTDIKRLENKAKELRKQIFSNLSRWQRVQLARHPMRPYSLDYIERICSYFEEFHGDRLLMNFRLLLLVIKKAVGQNKTYIEILECRIPKVIAKR